MTSRGTRARQRIARETDAEFLLRILSDGRPHNLNEILKQSLLQRGHGLTVHSRAANVRRDLRDQGFDVLNWKDGDRGNGSWYQIVPAGTTQPLEQPSPQVLLGLRPPPQGAAAARAATCDLSAAPPAEGDAEDAAQLTLEVAA